MTKKINEPTRIIGVDEKGNPIELPRAPSTNLFDLDPEGIPEKTDPFIGIQNPLARPTPTLAIPGAYAEALEPIPTLSDHDEITPEPKDISQIEGDEPLMTNTHPESENEPITVEGDEPTESDTEEVVHGEFVGFPAEEKLPAPPLKTGRTLTPTEIRQATEDAYVVEASHLASQHFIPMAIVDESQADTAEEQFLISLREIDRGRSHEVKRLRHKDKIEIWIKVNPEQTT